MPLETVSNACFMIFQRFYWHLDIAGCPKCNPQSAQCSSVAQSAPIRDPPCGTCKIDSGVRTWNCAGPGKASN
eukprot:3946423-Alexandrium_andersonii.AAC.1